MLSEKQKPFQVLQAEKMCPRELVKQARAEETNRDSDVTQRLATVRRHRHHHPWGIGGVLRLGHNGNPVLDSPL